jgi:hypothetical protein
VARDTGAAAGADRSILSGLSYSDAPIMLGDQGPGSVLRFFPHASLGPPPTPINPIPPVPPGPGPGNNRLNGAALVPSVRGFKIADNQSARPLDRVFFSFNYFDNVNDSVNKHLGAAVSGLQVYSETFGIEKTLLDERASVGIRFPLNTLYANSRIPALGGTSTSVGDMTIFGKYALWEDPKTGSILTAGLAITPPNGPRHFAGSAVGDGFRDSLIQPFIAYIWAVDRFYFQGFTELPVATDSRDVTSIFNDLGVGYYLYKNPDRNAWVSAFVPTFEVHINDPLNHRGALRKNDVAGTPDVVDLTYGANTLFGRRSVLSAGLVTPVTGPKPYDLEVLVLLNVYFGKTRASRPIAPTPPLLGP